jgi:hypothetical protein
MYANPYFMEMKLSPYGYTRPIVSHGYLAAILLITCTWIRDRLLDIAAFLTFMPMFAHEHYSVRTLN